MLSTFGTRNYTSNMTQPTKIHGRPTYLQIRKLEKELIKNAASVQCDEGGGAHGYIGLIKSPVQYEKLAPGTPFIMPVHPGILTIPNGTTGHESFRLQQNHLVTVDKYHEAVEIKKALGRMLENSIDTDLISEFLNEDTGLINKPLHEVFAHLYEFYGEVTQHDLKIVERDVDNMNYSITQPPSVIWKAIDDLQRLATAAKLKYTDAQLVDLGLTIIQGTHDFEKGQEEWIDLPANEITYANLKKHFNKAYKKLQKIRGEDMRGAAQHHANAMRMNFDTTTSNIQDEMLDKVNELKEDIIDVITAEKENIQPAEQSMNAATTHSTISTMTKLTTLLEGLEKRIDTMEKSCLREQPTDYNHTRERNNTPPWKRPGNKLCYCWSCGCQKSHEGVACTRKKSNHIDTATFDNRQGGNHKGIAVRFR